MNMFNFMSMTKENLKKQGIKELHHDFNKDDFDVEATIKKLMDKNYYPKNYDEQKPYYMIFEAIQHKMALDPKYDIDSYKKIFGQYEDEIYSRCSEYAEEVNKGEVDEDSDEEE